MIFWEEPGHTQEDLNLIHSGCVQYERCEYSCAPYFNFVFFTISFAFSSLLAYLLSFFLFLNYPWINGNLSTLEGYMEDKS